MVHVILQSENRGCGVVALGDIGRGVHTCKPWAKCRGGSARTMLGEVGDLAHVDVSRAARTRARHLDYDQRHGNATNDETRQKLEAPTELDPDKAGLGMFYCVECDRHFPNSNDREAHIKSKLHKRIAKKVLTEKPYTHEEALQGAGIGIDKNRHNSEAVELDI